MCQNTSEVGFHYYDWEMNHYDFRPDYFNFSYYLNDAMSGFSIRIYDAYDTAFFKISVNLPGKKVLARRRDVSFKKAIFSNSEISEIATESGLSNERFFI